MIRALKEREKRLSPTGSIMLTYLRRAVCHRHGLSTFVFSGGRATSILMFLILNTGVLIAMSISVSHNYPLYFFAMLL